MVTKILIHFTDRDEGSKGTREVAENSGEGMIVSVSENLTISESRDRFFEWVAQVF
jgi:hypothetical protein